MTRTDNGNTGIRAGNRSLQPDDCVSTNGSYVIRIRSEAAQRDQTSGRWLGRLIESRTGDAKIVSAKSPKTLVAQLAQVLYGLIEPDNERNNEMADDIHLHDETLIDSTASADVLIDLGIGSAGSFKALKNNVVLAEGPFVANKATFSAPPPLDGEEVIVEMALSAADPSGTGPYGFKAVITQNGSECPNSPTPPYSGHLEQSPTAVLFFINFTA